MYGKKQHTKAAPQPPVVIDLKDIPEVKDVAIGNNQFTNECSKILRAGCPTNFIYSPFYLRILVGMCKVGARGSTAEEIQNVFHFPEKDWIFSSGNIRVLTSLLAQNNKGIYLSEASAFYIKKGFEITMEFAQELFNLYNREVTSVDFSQSIMAAALINSWFERNTNGNIKLVINSEILNMYTRLLLINAVHFRGDWKEKFERRLTRKVIFHVNEKKEIEVDMMVKKFEVFYSNLVDLEAQAISLPYQGDRLQLMIVLPRNWNSFYRLKCSLDAANVFSRLNESHVVDIMLPRFRIESTLHFIQPMKQLGVRTMFDPTLADFSGVTGYTMNDLYMSEIIQKVVFECAEDDGVVVAPPPDTNKRASHVAPRPAAMGFGKGTKLAHFHADHPFLFALVDKLSGVIFFSGTCSNPTLS